MGKASGEAYRVIHLYVDAYESGIMKGNWYNPGLAGTGKTFESMVQFLTEAENLFDSMNFPQSYEAKRRFTAFPSPEAGTEAGQEDAKGKRGTFLIRILFRQHSSWQGIVTWTEGRGEQAFRSVLELILLIDSALNSRREDME